MNELVDRDGESHRETPGSDLAWRIWEPQGLLFIKGPWDLSIKSHRIDHLDSFDLFNHQLIEGSYAVWEVKPFLWC